MLNMIFSGAGILILFCFASLSPEHYHQSSAQWEYMNFNNWQNFNKGITALHQGQKNKSFLMTWNDVVMVSVTHVWTYIISGHRFYSSTCCSAHLTAFILQKLHLH